MSLLDNIKGEALLDTTITFKISTKQKKFVQKFAEKHNVSAGKLGRKGFDLVIAEIAKELAAGK